MKKLLFIFILFLMLFTTNTNIFASTNNDYIKNESYIKIFNESKELTFIEDFSYKKNNVTYLPLYFLISNDILKTKDVPIEDLLIIEKNVVEINSRSYVNINVLNINYDERYNVIYTKNIYEQKETLVNDMISSLNYSNDDFIWLSKIIYAEARGENYESKLGVGNVIKNRVNSHIFPNTIKDVIFDKKFGVQFSPVLDGSIYNNSNIDCKVVAFDVLVGINNASNALFFMNPTIAETNWIAKNRSFLTIYGNHHFYL